jgi:hypothetical protein
MHERLVRYDMATIHADGLPHLQTALMTLSIYHLPHPLLLPNPVATSVHALPLYESLLVSSVARCLCFVVVKLDLTRATHTHTTGEQRDGRSPVVWVSPPSPFIGSVGVSLAAFLFHFASLLGKKGKKRKMAKSVRAS